MTDELEHDIAPAPRRRRRVVLGSVLLVVLAVAVGLGAATAYFYDSSRRSEDLTHLAHAMLQQNIRARYDDCVAGDAVRRALYDQTRASARSDALLYKLLPTLNTPLVHKLVARNRKRQLAAFAPRGRRGCTAYALLAVPAGVRRGYRLPRR